MLVGFGGDDLGAYTPAAPVPPAPRQPIRSQESGESERIKPRIALRVN